MTEIQEFLKLTTCQLDIPSGNFQTFAKLKKKNKQNPNFINVALSDKKHHSSNFKTLMYSDLSQRKRC